jgi:hypothetical protein
MTAALDNAVAYHLGLVVHDLDAVAGRYEKILRVPEWKQIATAIGRIAFGRGAGLTYELIEPLQEGTIWHDFLHQRGEGVQHMGFWVPDVQAAVAEAVSAGARVTLARLDDGVAAVAIDSGGTTPELVSRIAPGGLTYLDAGHGGVQIELVGPASYAGLRERLGGDLSSLMVIPPWVER